MAHASTDYFSQFERGAGSQPPDLLGLECILVPWRVRPSVCPSLQTWRWLCPQPGAQAACGTGRASPRVGSVGPCPQRRPSRVCCLQSGAWGDSWASPLAQMFSHCCLLVGLFSTFCSRSGWILAVLCPWPLWSLDLSGRTGVWTYKACVAAAQMRCLVGHVPTVSLLQDAPRTLLGPCCGTRSSLGCPACFRQPFTGCVFGTAWFQHC